MNSFFNRRYSLIRKEKLNEDNIWRRRKRNSTDFALKACVKKKRKIIGLLEELERMVKTPSEQEKIDKLREESEKIIINRMRDILAGRNEL